MRHDTHIIKTIIQNAERIAILSGAGVSTPSGIKDFRSTDGLYSKNIYGLSPEKILSRHFFDTYRDLFYNYYLTHMIIPEDTKPNSIHYTTKQLDVSGKLEGVITQNIDGLYQKAGLSDHKLVEIHGNGSRWICMKCKQPVVFEHITHDTKTGEYFSPCHQFIVKPDIILYDEIFKPDDIRRAAEIYTNADVLLVMGTSLDILLHLNSVRQFKGKIVLINHTYCQLGNREWDAVYLGSISDAFNCL